MARATSLYVCQSCGAQSRQFFGRCSGCGNWNTLVEQSAAPTDNRRRRPVAAQAESAMPAAPRRSEPMAAVGDRPLQRLCSGYGELDRVLGGGLVPGSLVLLGGDPGIGKSTLLLQSAQAMAARHSVLYVSAEESAQQVKLRWRRLAEEQGELSPVPADASPGGPGLQLLAETDLELVLQELEALRPAVAVIDSIQALHDGELGSAPGSVAQVRECAAALARIAKRQDTALLLVGHVTKEGMLAGPKVLEKHLGLPLSRFDCYLAVAGGLEVEEPAADLGVAAAVVASYRDLTLPPGTVLIGELGLGGQLRPVAQLEQRLQESARLGFRRAVVPKGSGLGRLAAGLDLHLLEAGGVAEALVAALGVNPADDRA